MNEFDNTLFSINKEVMKGKNYIYGSGNHANHMGNWFDIHGIPYEGFVYISGNKSVSENKRIITLEEFKELDDAHLLITQNQWQEAYDNLWPEVDWRKIYVNSTWYRGKSQCIMCDNDLTFSTDAEFAPFLEERIWGGRRKITQIVHCPRCKCYYSLYRPSDAETNTLYSGYRGEEYLKQRSHFESEYTEEFNRELKSPSDGGKARKGRIWDFVKTYIKKENVKKVLDYGGDEGQFIPDELDYADRYVYEISGNKVIDGVTLLNEKKKISEFEWDLIFCNQVLEHLSNPRILFKELASYISEKTLLYIEVPMERYMENKDFVFIHEHINFFREEIFEFWAKENNLKIIKTGADGIIQVLFGR